MESSNFTNIEIELMIEGKVVFKTCSVWKTVRLRSVLELDSAY